MTVVAVGIQFWAFCNGGLALQDQLDGAEIPLRRETNHAMDQSIEMVTTRWLALSDQ